MWESILDSVQPDSGGIYTSVEDFPDSELFEMIKSLAEHTNTPANDLVKEFGLYLFHTLAAKHQIFVDAEPDFFAFLKSIDNVIHKEVEKLYPNPNLPNIDWEQPDSQTLKLFYRSPRKLCHLASGLIRGAASQYNVEFTMSHDPCMHNDSDHCCFEIKIK